MSTLVAAPGAGSARVHSRRLPRLWPEYATLLCWGALVACGVTHHEPWADEAQAWQIASNQSISYMLLHGLRYEGSPSLWHIVLHLLNALHVTYAGMHWVAAGFAFCGMVVLAVFAPFPRWLRLSLPFTFFFAYQYAVIARSYVMVPLLAFGAVAVWKRRPIAVAVLLGLLANTSMHGFALAVGFAVVYTIETIQGRHADRKRWIAFVVFISLICVALFTVIPPPRDLSFGEDVFHLQLRERIWVGVEFGIVYLLKSASLYWPLSLLIVPAVYWLTAKAAGVQYLIPVAAVTIFSGCFFSFWHLGFAMVAIIGTAWVAWQPSASRGLRRLAIVTAIAWIGIQICYSVHAFRWEWQYDYSPDAKTAQYLSPIVLKGGKIAVTEINRDAVGTFHAVGILPYFRRSIFMNQPKPYWPWNESREQMDAKFDQALRSHPDVVVGMFFTRRSRRFNPKYDLYSWKLRELYGHGYAVNRVFCGEKPEGLGFREEICEVILGQSAIDKKWAPYGR